MIAMTDIQSITITNFIIASAAMLGVILIIWFMIRKSREDDMKSVERNVRYATEAGEVVEPEAPKAKHRIIEGEVITKEPLPELSVSQKILNAMDSKAMMPKELSEILGLRADNISQVLRRLAKQKKVRRTVKGFVKVKEKVSA